MILCSLSSEAWHCSRMLIISMLTVLTVVKVYHLIYVAFVTEGHMVE